VSVAKGLSIPLFLNHGNNMVPETIVIGNPKAQSMTVYKRYPPMGGFSKQRSE